VKEKEIASCGVEKRVTLLKDIVLLEGHYDDKYSKLTTDKRKNVGHECLQKS